ncbi:MAG: glycosyltransferase family 9 protein [bacterium]
MKVLIVKLGALGDVVRTTALLPAIKGDAHWLTSPSSYELLCLNPYLKCVYRFGDDYDHQRLLGQYFDLVISLDEELPVLQLVQKVKRHSLVGVYVDEITNEVKYTDHGKGWFDMSLISRHGKEKADELKKQNNRTFQEYLYEMFSLPFTDQEYQLGVNLSRETKYAVGVERWAGGERWPTKRWSGYDQLYDKLKERGIPVVVFTKRAGLLEYLSDINDSRVIVCGDTLAMHLALALQKKVVAIFGPTSPMEIHDYGRMVKLYDKEAPCFCSYKPNCYHQPQCIDRVLVDTVYEHTLKMLERL